MEHLIGPLIRGVFFVIVGYWMIRNKIFAPKLVNVKTALVDVEVNISFIKIRCAGFPNFGFGVKRFHRLPRTVTDAFGSSGAVNRI